MKNTKIKIVSIALAAALTTSAYVVLPTAADTSAGAPDYIDGTELFVNEFAIGAWCEPKGTAEDIQMFKDAGFNVMYLGNENSYNSSDFNHMKNLAGEYGLYYMISNGGNRLAPVSIRIADNSIIDIKNDSNFLGVMPADEPLGGTSAVVDQVTQNTERGIMQNFNTIYHYIADEFTYLTQNYGNKIFDVVLAIGVDSNDFGYGSMESMTELVYPLMSAENRTISFDYYPCLTGDLKTNSASFIYKLHKTRTTADTFDGGTKYRIYYYGQEWNNTDQTREYADESNVTYQIYTAMTYGMNMFVAYKYAAYWNEFVIDRDFIQNYYNYTEYWWYNKLAMDEIKNYDYIYLPFADDWRGTMFFEGSQNTRTEMRANEYAGNGVTFLASHDRIASVSTTQDLLIGTFKDSAGRDGFMLANQANPFDKLGTTVSVKFNNANKALAIIDGEQKTVDLTDGVLNMELNNGGGAFVIPYNE